MKILPFRPFQNAAVVEYIRHPPSKRNDAGENPAGSANDLLPGGVKVARRFVKPHGVGASPTLAANFQGVMSAADGLVRNEEVAGATPATLTISGRQADISWLHLSRKQDPYSRRWVHYPRLPPLSCSSRAEHPADNRKTAEHYRAGQPTSSLDGVVSLHAGLKSRRCRRNPDSSGHRP